AMCCISFHARVARPSSVRLGQLKTCDTARLFSHVSKSRSGSARSAPERMPRKGAWSPSQATTSWISWGEWVPQPGGIGADAWQNPHRHRWMSPDDGRTKPFGQLTGVDDLAWAHMSRIGKKAADLELDGRTWDQYPATIMAG